MLHHAEMKNVTVLKLVRQFPSREKISYGRTPNFYFTSRELVKLGVTVHVISTRAREEKKDEKVDGIAVHRVGSPYNINLYTKMREIDEKYNLDVVHIYATAGFAYAIYKILLGGKPLIATIPHIRRGAAGIPFHYSPIVYLKNRFWTAVSVPRRVIAWRHADMLIAISKATARDLTEIYGVPPEKIRVVYNGVDPEIFAPIEKSDVARRLGLEGKRIVLYVGDFGLRKGLRYLIQAVPKVISEVPDARFLLVGGTPRWLGTDIYWKMLLEQIKRCGVQEHVRLLGSVSHFELPKYYSAAEVFVLPSLHEGLGKVALEAMTCEKPVVATRVGGIPEIVDDGVDGILVPPMDSNGMADAIIDLLSDEKRATAMGRTGRSKVLERFTWKETAKRLVAAYESLV